MTTPSRALAVRDTRARTLPDKIEYAQFLAESGLLPAQYRKRPENVLWAMEYGEALGIPAIAAIIGVHVIEGKPGASPALMSALVRKAGHRLRVWLDQQAMTAYAELVRADDPEFTFRAEWDLDRAVTAQLCTIKGGKPYARSKDGKLLSWEKYPGNMLKWRCVSEVCRDGAEECLMGMHYTPEELGAEVDSQGEPLRVTAERVTEPRPEPAPPSHPATREPVRVRAERVPSSPAAEHSAEAVRLHRERHTPEATTETPSATETASASPAMRATEPESTSTDWDARIARCEADLDLPGIRELYKEAGQKEPGNNDLCALIEYAGISIKEMLAEQAAALRTAEPDSPAETAEELSGRKSRDELRAELFALLGKGGVKGEEMKPERLRICSRLTVPNRVPEITSTNELSDLEVAQVIVALRRYDREGTLTETLAAMSGVST